MNGGGHLGTVLPEEGLITEDVLSRAIESTKEKDQPLGRVLVDEGFLPEADLVRALARHIGIEFVDLSEITVDPAAASLIPDSLARRYAALPIGFDGEKLVIAMADPGNVLAVDDIRAISGMEVITRVTTRSDVDNALSRLAGLDDSVTDLAEMAADGVEQEDQGAVESAADEAPVIKLVNTLITRAAAERASDIHIEPNERDLLIRYRIDGSAPRPDANAPLHCPGSREPASRSWPISTSQSVAVPRTAASACGYRANKSTFACRRFRRSTGRKS